MNASTECLNGLTLYDSTSTRMWGSGYIRNPVRINRVIPPVYESCPICTLKQDPNVALNRCITAGAEYNVAFNSKPIVTGQQLFCPIEHRETLCQSDYALIALLVTLGRQALSSVEVQGHVPCLPEFLPDSTPARLACYVNTSPEGGRSVSHLHINAINASVVPLPEGAPAVWEIACGAGGATLKRFDGLPFYALTLSGPASGVYDTLTAIHEALLDWEIPYNLLAYPEYRERIATTRFIVVPRRQCFIGAVGQKLGGFEFLTGLLIPSREHWEEMNVTIRDQALAEATLDAEEALRLDRLLRGRFGLPTAGCGVYAIGADLPGMPPYRAHIQFNRSMCHEDSPFALEV